MYAILNAELVLRDHFMPEAVLFVEDGKIVSFGEMRNTTVPAGCKTVDAHGLYVAPGLFDIHTHAGNGKSFKDDALHAARHHMDHGTTSLLATAHTRMPLDGYVRYGATIHEAMKSPDGANIIGIYMEGPYINPKYGANRLAKHHLWDKPVLPEDYEPIVAACGDLARVWGLAPERGADQLIPLMQAAKRANPAVRFAVTHSEASPAQIEALIPYGLCIGTHHTNATGDLPKYPECRGVCVDETVNYRGDIWAEMISDSRGIHVDPYMQRLIRKIKGPDRLILISDCTADTYPAPEGYEGVTDINFDEFGEISGSRLSLDVAARNFMKHTGASLVDAFRCCGVNPAAALGYTDRGEIAPGMRADLIFIDEKVNVKTVILNGKIVRG